MNATDMLLDPIRLASLAILAPFLVRSLWHRWQARTYRRIIAARLREIAR